MSYIQPVNTISGCSHERAPAGGRGVTIHINGPDGKAIDYTALPARHYQCSHLLESWTLPDHLGTGEFRKIDLGQGIVVGMGQARLQAPLEETVYDHTPGIIFISCLSGSLWNKNQCFSNGFELSPGTCALYYSPDPEICRQTGPDDNLQKVIIKIPLDQIAIFENTYLEEAVQTQKPFLDCRFLCVGMRQALAQVMGCSFRGRVRQLYLEGKTLELIAHWISMDGTPRAKALKPGEPARIRQARDLLLQDFGNVPSLMELSKAVGLTHTRLNHGFKMLFGQTVFEWFRGQRLEKARVMILEKNKSITEIAYEVGFASSSHFTHAFGKYFGTLPSHIND